MLAIAIWSATGKSEPTFGSLYLFLFHSIRIMHSSSIAYNGRIEALRETEYPMLRGRSTP